MKRYDLVIIGGGCCGLSCAVESFDLGIKNILVIEKNESLGGILNQCIHNGFGLKTFKEELSGPMYAQRYIDQIKERNIDYRLNTTVSNVSSDKVVSYSNEVEGFVEVQAGAVVLALGAIEKTYNSLSVATKRLSGIYSAGNAQKYLNIDGYLVGKKVLIVGSGDIGLIMAKRMTLEGAKVLGVVEILPYSNGLNRNIVQCLHDFDIPLYLSYKVKQIIGDKKVEKVIINQIDENFNYIDNQEIVFDVDCVLYSVGLLPDTNICCNLQKDVNGKVLVDQNYMTSSDGIFTCGNGLHVHDLVDYVTFEAKRCALGVFNYLNDNPTNCDINVVNMDNVSYIIPQKINYYDKFVNLMFRVKKPINNCDIEIICDGTVVRKLHQEQLLPSLMVDLIVTKNDLVNCQKELSIKIKEVNHD
ncbi:MAG: NAD(P)/FAD-dependent oxidoreductase [Erysipelotrichaceae bacterium]